MFSIQEFLIYRGDTEAKRPKYSIIAAGVISQVEQVYKIILTSKTINTRLLFTDGLTLKLEYTPINSITSVTYLGDTVDYTYNTTTQELTLISALQDNTIPVDVVITAGYSDINPLPADLKFAIYEHINDLIFKSENHTPSVVKSINTTGNTTFFRDNILPVLSEQMYNFYSKRQIVA